MMNNVHNLQWPSLAQPGANHAGNRKTLAWLGSSGRDEVAEAFAFCAQHFPQIAVRRNLSHLADFPAEQVSDVIVVRSDRRPPPVVIHRLFELLPGVRWWSIASSECEGERRTGIPWAGLEHMYWHRWNQILPNWFEVPAVTQRLTTVVLSRDVEMRQDISRFLSQDNHSVLSYCHPEDANVFNADICFWDDTIAPPVSASQWQTRIHNFNARSSASVRHVWLANFPRIQQWRAAKLGGVHNLISKPFHLSAFSYVLNRYREATELLGCLDA